MRMRTLLATAVAGALATGVAGLPAHAEPVPSPIGAGTVSAWGAASTVAATTIPEDLTAATIADVATNSSTTAAVSVDGSFHIWGAASPVVDNAPEGVEDAKAVSLINGYGLLLRADGSVMGWGVSPEIGAVPDGLRAKAISAGMGTGYAVRANGTLAVWGNEPAIPVPAEVTALTDLVDVSASLQHTMVLRANGTALSWGNPALPTLITVPDMGGKKITQITTGQLTSGAVLEDGSFKVWPADNALATAAPDLTGKKVRSLDLGFSTAAATTEDNVVELWGATAAITAQEANLTGTPVSEISIGQNHAAAITTVFREVATPTIAGTPAVGQVLTATPAVYSLAPDEAATGQWYAGPNKLTGKTGNTLTLDLSMLGTSIRYESTATRGSETIPSMSTAYGPVTKAPSTTTLALNPASAVVGSTRTVTATVAAAGVAPTGAVTFTAGGTSYTQPLAGGTASWTLPALAVGSHPVTAAYSGDSSVAASTSAAAAATVTKAASVVSGKAKVSGKTKKVAKKVVITVTVKPGASVSPAGKVTVTLKGKTKKKVTGKVNAKGVATVVLKKLKRGKYTATLTYAGNDSVLAGAGKVKFKA